MKNFIEQQQQEIVKEFGLPKRLIQNQDRHITATEVRLQQEMYRPIFKKMAQLMYITWIKPMHKHLFRMYNMYEGRKRTDGYYVNIIKTM